jgi:hypothetical protein
MLPQVKIPYSKCSQGHPVIPSWGRCPTCKEKLININTNGDHMTLQNNAPKKGHKLCDAGKHYVHHLTLKSVGGCPQCLGQKHTPPSKSTEEVKTSEIMDVSDISSTPQIEEVVSNIPIVPEAEKVSVPTKPILKPEIQRQPSPIRLGDAIETMLDFLAATRHYDTILSIQEYITVILNRRK